MSDRSAAVAVPGCAMHVLIGLQVRSLQRMASNALVRGISSSLCSSSLTTRGISSRQGSSSGGYMPAVGHASRAASRLAIYPIGNISENGTVASEGALDDHAGLHGGDLSPITPARPSGICGGDLLGEPLMVGKHIPPKIKRVQLVSTSQLHVRVSIHV